MARRSGIPLERDVMVMIAKWRRSHPDTHPVSLMYHVPNEAKRSKRAGARAKAEGLRPGVPDFCLPVPRAHYHGLYIELKRAKPARTQVSKHQRWWLDQLTRQGYRAELAYGFDDFIQQVEDYLAL